MAQFVNMYPVDLAKGPLIANIKTTYQGNANANRIGAIVTENGKDKTLGGRCAGLCVRADGNSVPLTGTVSGNQAYVTLDGNCYEVPGQIIVFVTWVASSSAPAPESIADTAEETTLLCVYGNVVATSSGAIIQPVEHLPDYAQLLSAIEDMEDATSTATTAITSAFTNIAPTEASTTASRAYTAGEHFFLGGVLYEATADIAQGGIIVTSGTGKNCKTTVLGAEVTHLERGIFSVLAADAATIPDNTDLDTVTDPGNYKVTTNASAATMTHGPASTPYRLLVLETVGTSSLTQIAIIAIAGDGHQMALRYKNSSNVWTDWYPVPIMSDFESLIYDGRDKTKNTPKVPTYFSTSGLTSFGLADMPAQSYTFISNPSKFTDLPTGYEFSTTYGVYICKELLNSSTVFIARVIDPQHPDAQFVRRYQTGESSPSAWIKLPVSSDISQLDSLIYEGRDKSKNTPKVLTRFAPTGSFGIADMPPQSYVFVSDPTRFTDLPTDYTFSSTYGVYISRENMNASGTLSVVRVIDPHLPENQFIKRYSEAEVTVFPWVKLPLNADIDSLKNVVRNYNVYPYSMFYGVQENKTQSGAVFAWNADKTVCTVTAEQPGTASSGDAFCNIFNKNASINAGIAGGGKYYFVCESTNSTKLYCELWYYVDNVLQPSAAELIKESKSITIPSGVTAIIYRIYAKPGVVYNDTIRAEVLSTNIETGEVTNVTNEYITNQYDQSITLNASPTITADTNNYLAPSGDNTDRTADILALLSSTGVCQLGPGNYYVAGVVMPDHTTISGCGFKSRIILLGSGAGTAITMGTNCTVKDIAIYGQTSSLSDISSIGNRDGILWQGTYNVDQGTPSRGMVYDVRFRNLSGSAIKMNNTGYGTSDNLTIIGCYAAACGCGINIAYWSEFHRISDCTITGCYIGAVNNGGNNIFVNCNFSSNTIGMLFDNSQGQSPNNTHGSIIGCIFDHEDENTGLGIKMIGCHAGEVFSDCQLFYAGIEVINCSGVQFNNFNTGNSVHITVTEGSNGGLVIFNNWIFKASAYTITKDYNNVKFVNCWTRDGTAVTGA